ncbi:hypothetical protein FG99_00100 [Pseudomonas sp. AAC]|nr:MULTISPECIES: DUF2514 family protein [Pseudomonas]KES20143.1 hypothetical protein FG99_00100 [Pseudomonas sp. AAC]MBH3433670.1 DUF2514 family protein [Pseudomonas citronellolis]
MAWLKLVPTWCWAALAGLALTILVGVVQQIRVSSAQADAAIARGELADYRTEIAERDRRAALAALAETKRRQQAVEEIESDAKGKLEQARADSADGLQREVNRLRAGRSATCSAVAAGARQPGESAIGVLADLLDEFVRRNRVLGAAADASRVAGLACELSYQALQPQ